MMYNRLFISPSSVQVYLLIDSFDTVLRVKKLFSRPIHIVGNGELIQGTFTHGIFCHYSITVYYRPILRVSVTL